ncbi:MAG TPA: hypothetical protein VFP72_02330 [Kineosporiaceae bacterium]|nr:hypothetical protein [Kineosporiaceae bacterium]
MTIADLTRITGFSDHKINRLRDGTSPTLFSDIAEIIAQSVDAHPVTPGGYDHPMAERLPPGS